MTPILTLPTDFGLADHYAGTMKGVILSRCPGAIIVDISHEVAPFSVWSGAYTIDQAAPYFPAGTVHAVVVDPGVGTSRRAILAEAIGQLFVAPDNGVLSMILSRDSGASVREITNPQLFLEPLSSTFHGRDLFAPVAASLASGTVGSDRVGPLLSRPELLPDLEPLKVANGNWLGRVLSVDRFGNVITNFRASRFREDSFAIRFRKRVVETYRKTFSGAAEGECFVYSGSSGFIELAINQGNAAGFLGISPGDKIELHLTKPIKHKP